VDVLDERPAPAIGSEWLRRRRWRHRIRGLGDIALARSDQEGARARYEEALVLYQRIEEPCSIGMAHRGLAGVVLLSTCRRS
jgi:hypothetical protein